MESDEPTIMIDLRFIQEAVALQDCGLNVSVMAKVNGSNIYKSNACLSVGVCLSACLSVCVWYTGWVTGRGSNRTQGGLRD